MQFHTLSFSHHLSSQLAATIRSWAFQVRRAYLKISVS